MRYLVLIFMLFTFVTFTKAQRYSLQPMVKDLTEKSERALKEVERLQVIIARQKKTIENLKNENTRLRNKLLEIERIHS